MNVPPLDLSRLKIFPLSERKNLTRADDILIDPDAPAKTCSDPSAALIRQCARDIHAARKRDAAVMLIYGAHLLRNGAARILERMMAPRLDHAPGDQRRRHDPRLGIRLVWRLDRKRGNERR